MNSKWFAVTAACFLSILLFAGWTIGQKRAAQIEMAASIKHAQQLGLPFDQYEQMLKKLSATGMSVQDARAGVEHVHWTYKSLKGL